MGKVRCQLDASKRPVLGYVTDGVVGSELARQSRRHGLQQHERHGPATCS
jgi:hypothetical protein